METSFDVELLNVCKYVTKEDNRKRTMLNYRLLDNNALQSKGDKFKGYSVLSQYYDGHEVYDKIPAEWCGCKVTFVLTKQVSQFDPTKEVSRVVKINDINLV